MDERKAHRRSYGVYEPADGKRLTTSAAYDIIFPRETPSSEKRAGGGVPLAGLTQDYTAHCSFSLSDFPRFVQYAARIAAALQLIQPIWRLQNHCEEEN